MSGRGCRWIGGLFEEGACVWALGEKYRGGGGAGGRGLTLPAVMMKGTPNQRRLSMCSAVAAKVAVDDGVTFR